MIALIVFGKTLFSQNLNDKNWILGFGKIATYTWPGGDTLNFGGTWLDFGSTPPDTLSFSSPMRLVYESATLSNSDGLLQFYTNGCRIYSWNHKLMKNGDSLNAPGDNFHFCAQEGAYDAYHSIFALPQPDHDSIFYVFHLRYDAYSDFQSPRSFLYTKVHMSKEGGLGRVMEKNVPILKDTFAETLTAV